MTTEFNDSFTKLTRRDPLWKVQAWCRRTEGTYYLYQTPDGKIEVSTFDRPAEEMENQCLEKWVNGERVFRDLRRPETANS